MCVDGAEMYVLAKNDEEMEKSHNSAWRLFIFPIQFTENQPQRLEPNKLQLFPSNKLLFLAQVHGHRDADVNINLNQFPILNLLLK